uniref:HORMA domain containing 1 n=1 Tax=Salarias fasciatus TaxID=181472 RepID=A0A672GRK3_SALFA
MASVQQLRTSQLTPDQVVTEQQSLIVMKKLLAIAVSGITYLRGIFPGKFLSHSEVVILREEHSCPGVIHILHCAEMLKKPTSSFSLQLSSLLLFQKVLEVYQFKIQYNTGGALMDFESNNNSKLSMSCGNTKAASILLVRKLYTLMQNLGPLPDTVCLSMKLAYYDDITPLDYQPPGFKEAESGTMEFESEPLRLTMGEVVTPFHSLKLDMTTERRHDTSSSHKAFHCPQQWNITISCKKFKQLHDPVPQTVSLLFTVKTLQNRKGSHRDILYLEFDTALCLKSTNMLFFNNYLIKATR